MRKHTLFLLVVVAYLALANGVKSEAVRAQRGEAPYMAIVYYRSDMPESPIRGKSYSAVLVRPTMLISGDCCGLAPPSIERKNPVARLGALTVGSDNTEDNLIQERMVVHIAKLRGGAAGSGVALLVEEPFHLTPSVGVVLLAATGVASQTEKICQLYQFSHMADDSDVDVRTLQRRAVRAMSRHNCSQSEASTAIYFRNIDSLAPEDDVSVGGAVLCDGRAVALVGEPGSAHEVGDVRTQQPSPQLVELAAWRQVALCTDMECLDRNLDITDKSATPDVMALFESEAPEADGASTAAAPADGKGKKSSAPTTVNPAGPLAVVTLLTLTLWLEM